MKNADIQQLLDEHTTRQIKSVRGWGAFVLTAVSILGAVALSLFETQAGSLEKIRNHETATAHIGQQVLNEATGKRLERIESKLDRIDIKIDRILENETH